MLRGARIEAEWMNAPTANDVRHRDQERLIEKLLAPVEHEADDLELARRLLTERSAEDIAASLARAHRAPLQIGRATGRERVSQSVSMQVSAQSIKKTQERNTI